MFDFTDGITPNIIKFGYIRLNDVSEIHVFLTNYLKSEDIRKRIK